MTTPLVTGANRGIGFEHVRQALMAGKSVVDACRAPTDGDALDLLRADHPSGQLRIKQLDTADPASVEALAARLNDVVIDILIDNAGLYGPPGAPAWPDGTAVQTLEGMDYALWNAILRTNVVSSRH